MKPYYEEPGITIYLGDCRDILPHLEPVDLVLTDPPYGGVLNKKHGHGKLKEAVIKYGNSDWDYKPEPSVFKQLISAGKSIIIWGGNYFSDCLPVNRCWLVWDKLNGDSSFADCELAWTNLDQAVRKFPKHIATIENRTHPTQKPIELMSWCINQAGEPQTILDPFIGSGTTLRAAKDLGRKAIGIEIEEKYCEISVKRLQQEVFDFK